MYTNMETKAKTNKDSLMDWGLWNMFFSCLFCFYGIPFKVATMLLMK